MNEYERDVTCHYVIQPFTMILACGILGGFIYFLYVQSGKCFGTHC